MILFQLISILFEYPYVAHFNKFYIKMILFEFGLLVFCLLNYEFI